ncbi:FIST N-terminal domain-containing protein [Tropicibacter naphthalenivorans]|uniref:FIST N-terminal domain-containing protein n=1 Tax=Tropicibacter naphthalenivorans TaxID=441103 RepID=UPI003521D7B1
MGATNSSAREEKTGQAALRTAQVPLTALNPAKELGAQLGDGPFAMVCLFASPDADFADLTREAHMQFRGADVFACTTAGELGTDGYEKGQIIAVAFPRAYFAVSAYVIDDLDQMDDQDVIDTVIQRRMMLNRTAPDMNSEFAFVMVDGLSLREEHLAGVLASGLGPMPLFGGSSGDGTAFHSTWLSHNGTLRRNAALLALVRSRCPVKVFSLDNLIPTETRMVVTSADPDARIVHEINAEPAAQEYARLLGKDPNQLDPFTFAAYPVVVRLGDTHHVRAIQRVSENGDLVFFSAINEGMVLSLADSADISAHLDQGLDALARDVTPDHILGCDCLLRRIEAGQLQKTREISEILRNHKVVGFSTYGEQIGSLHVNQTFTGVAIYPPPPDAGA